MEPQLLHRVTDGVATVVIHHPAKRNAMTAGMWKALPPDHAMGPQPIHRHRGNNGTFLRRGRP
ncbi:hypothetical protein ACWDAZ_37565, partial [Streptomyces sp. NPDC001215]